MKSDYVQIGCLVESTQGRDKGRIYMITKVVDKNYALLVDGDIKKQQNPKLKKLKHVKSLNIKLEKIEKKLNENTKVFDTEVYSAIKKALENK